MPYFLYSVNTTTQKVVYRYRVIIMAKNIGQEPDIKLTDFAIEWLYECGTPFVTLDFAGYIAKITNKWGCIVGIDNTIIPFSLNKKKPYLTEKQVKRFFNYLLKTNFIKDASLDPYPLFEKYSNIKVDVNTALKVYDYFYDKNDKSGEDFVPDDSVGGLDWFLSNAEVVDNAEEK